MDTGGYNSADGTLKGEPEGAIVTIKMPAPPATTLAPGSNSASTSVISLVFVLTSFVSSLLLL